MLLAPLLVLAAAPQGPVEVVAPEKALLLRVADAAELERAGILDLDLVARAPRSSSVEAVARPRDIDRLRAAGVRHEVLVEDLAAFYAERLAAGGPEGIPDLGAWLTPPFGQGSMGGYYTFAEVVSVLDQIHAAHPGIVAPKASLGTSLEGRPLWMLKVSDNPLVDEPEPEARFDALHHAREPGSMQTTLWFLLWLVERYGIDPLATYLVDERELFFVLVVNPDGYVHNQTTNPGGGGMWRKNRRLNGDGSRGVDLNRNYAYQWGYDNQGSSPTPSSETYRGTAPASEPEIAAMQAFIDGRQFATSVSSHTYSALWLYPWGYEALLPSNVAHYVELSALATEANHYVAGPVATTLYKANGATIDYEHGLHGTMAWTPEIGTSSDGFWPPTARIVPLAEENLPGLQRTALAAGPYVRAADVQMVEVGDGDGHHEPGESVRFVVTARNSGLQASAPIAVQLATSDPHAAITAGQHLLGTLSPFSQASTPPAALELDLLASATPGVPVPFTLTLLHQGHAQVIAGEIPVGEPFLYIADDVELDLGWTRGVPGDNATSGLWTRGAPIGTSTGGQPVAPGADATPPPGIHAFVTGNGGGNAGTDDVDNGRTTLLTPVFDLSGVGPATLSYARWFADFTTPDDSFDISISSDGGTSWVPVESVTSTENQWTTRSFRIPDLVPQTATMRLRFTTADQPNNSLVEAGVDDLAIHIHDATPRLSLFGRPVAGGTLLLGVTGDAGAPYQVHVEVLAPGGPLMSAPYRARVLAGVIPPDKVARIPVTVPSDPAASGRSYRYRAAVLQGGVVHATNAVQMTVE